jgi:hypothetical protein
MCLLFSVIFYLLKEFEVHSKHHRVFKKRLDVWTKTPPRLKKCGHPFQNHLRLFVHNINQTKENCRNISL